MPEADKQRKQDLVTVYDTFIDTFDPRYRAFFEEHTASLLDVFLARLPAHARILDLGCGPGHHSLYMKERGYDVLSIDLSPAMVQRCIERGLNAIEGDIEDLPENIGTFDGIWMHTSLLHVPKINIPAVLASLHKHLKPKGWYGVTVWEGDEEGPREADMESYGTRRWYTYFTDAEVRRLCEPHFLVQEPERIEINNGKKVFLHYQMQGR